MTISVKDIYNAADLIAGSVINTPCTISKTLSEITGAEVILKFENHQFTASFKDRGALVKLLSLTTEQQKAGEEAVKKAAAAVGLTPEQLAKTNSETMARFGWDADTPIAHVLHKLADKVYLVKTRRIRDSSEGDPVLPGTDTG